jgi:hypothetical protein
MHLRRVNMGRCDSCAVQLRQLDAVLDTAVGMIRGIHRQQDFSIPRQRLDVGL